MLWGSNTFHVNGKVQPKIFLTLFTTYCHSWGQGWETSSDSVCFTLKEFDGKGSLRELNVCSAWPWKKGRGPGWSGRVTPTSLSAPAPAPGELGTHSRNRKTGWVLALPLTTYVTLGKLLNISGSQLQYRVVVRVQ